MRRAIIMAGVLALAACGGGGGSDSLAVSGTFTLTDSEGFVGGWDSCSGDGGYDDFGPGMNVTVRDGDGSIVGTGTTESLEDADAPDIEAEEGARGGADGALGIAAMMAKDLMDGTWCTVKFEVPVKRAEFYEIEVGRRGELSYSYEELEDNDWWVELNLG
jgi:hypothetical protein